MSWTWQGSRVDATTSKEQISLQLAFPKHLHHHFSRKSLIAGSYIGVSHNYAIAFPYRAAQPPHHSCDAMGYLEFYSFACSCTFLTKGHSLFIMVYLLGYNGNYLLYCSRITFADGLTKSTSQPIFLFFLNF
ncbi:hypothetical protein KIL84_020053 [Mauremys mutica]|uniref:Uncharacterized protein n=1 Tax=Mauremys mutica TaxID=74926 RepID=A0A9D4BBV4_9SAUR|nr:hypothetical protein KIL84_020053 [Mauremys mutica]